MAVNPDQVPTPINDQAAVEQTDPKVVAAINGHDTASTVPNKRAMPVHYEKVELDGEFEGWWAVVRTNPRQSTIEKLSDPLQTYDGLHELMKDHNFVDEEGTDIPKTREGTGIIPVDLGLIIINRWNDVRKLPPQNAGK